MHLYFLWLPTIQHCCTFTDKNMINTRVWRDVSQKLQFDFLFQFQFGLTLVFCVVFMSFSLSLYSVSVLLLVFLVTLVLFLKLNEEAEGGVVLSVFKNKHNKQTHFSLKIIFYRMFFLAADKLFSLVVFVYYCPACVFESTVITLVCYCHVVMSL